MCDFAEELTRNTTVVHVKELTWQNAKNVIALKCHRIVQKVDQSDIDICDAAMQIHLSTLKEFGTSQHDLFGLIDVWVRLFESHNKKHVVDKETLKLGLQKLYDTNITVNSLREESEQVKSEITKAQADADKAMSDITSELASSKIKMADIDNLKLIITEKSEECKMNKNEIEMELAKIRPMLEASEQGKLLL